MSRKILIALLGVLLVAALAGAGTFAYFSDTETSTGNSFAAGTLNLRYSLDGRTTWADGTNANFTLANLKPGDSGTQTFTLDNDGSLPGTLAVSAVTVTNDAGVNTEAEGNTTGDLGASILVNVYLNDTAATPIYSGTLNGLASVTPLNLGTLAAGGTANLIINWEIPGSVGNEIQGDTATVDMTFALTQQQPQ